MTERSQEIRTLIEQISRSADLAHALSLDDTSRLLAMVLLDLQTKLHAVSPDELERLDRTAADVVAFKAPQGDAAPGDAPDEGSREGPGEGSGPGPDEGLSE